MERFNGLLPCIEVQVLGIVVLDEFSRIFFLTFSIRLLKTFREGLEI